MLDFPVNKKIVLFDGVCNLCNNTVITIIKNDTSNHFVFASLQSTIGKEICSMLQIDTPKTDSIVLYEPINSYYAIKSNAALKIMKQFGGWWKLTQLFWIVPRSIRDYVYDFIAKNRYKWFGKQESCMIPTQELTTKFLD